MNLKTRIALNLSIAFSIIMGIVMTVIYISFANFRKAEFKENLEHSAVVTANYISKLPSNEREKISFGLGRRTCPKTSKL